MCGVCVCVSTVSRSGGKVYLFRCHFTVVFGSHQVVMHLLASALKIVEIRLTSM